VRVRALPDALPRSIEHDISEVELGGSVHVHELVVPAGVAIVTDPEGGIASIMATRASLSDGIAEAGEGEDEGGAPAAAAAPAGDSGDGEE